MAPTVFSLVIYLCMQPVNFTADLGFHELNNSLYTNLCGSFG